MSIIKLTRVLGDIPIYINRAAIESFYQKTDKYAECSVYTVLWPLGSDKSYKVKETPEEILRLIEEAEQPSHTVAGGYSPSYLPNNSTMISPADLEASRVQQLVDGAHAVEQLMREKDPTYEILWNRRTNNG